MALVFKSNGDKSGIPLDLLKAYLNNDDMIKIISQYKMSILGAKSKCFCFCKNALKEFYQGSVSINSQLEATAYKSAILKFYSDPPAPQVKGEIQKRRTYRLPQDEYEEEMLHQVTAHFLKKLNHHIDFLGLSNNDIAERVYGDRGQTTTIKKMLSGDFNPTLMTLIRIAIAVGCQLELDLTFVDENL